MALTAAAPRKSEEDPNLAYYPMAVAVAYQGGLAVLDASGYVKPGVSATSLTAVGIFDFTADVMEGKMDNSGGSAGDLYARVRRGVFCFKNKSGDLVVEADVQKFCYVYDDDTVCHTGTSRSVAGIVRRVDSDGVWVQIGAAFGDALTSEIAAREALDTDLQSSTGTTLAGVLGVKQAANVADGAAGLPVVLTQAVADGATGNVDVTMPAYKIEVTSVVFNKNASAGGASDTIQLANGATTNYITNAMDINVAANTVVRSTTLLSANATLAASATLRIIRTKASAANVGGTVVVTGVRRA